MCPSQVQSGLAAWLAGLPIVLVAGDALVVHAGVPLEALDAVAAATAPGTTVHTTARVGLFFCVHSMRVSSWEPARQLLFEKRHA